MPRCTHPNCSGRIWITPILDPISREVVRACMLCGRSEAQPATPLDRVRWLGPKAERTRKAG